MSKKILTFTMAAVLGLSALGIVRHNALTSAEAAYQGSRNTTRDLYPELKKKIVPIITVGSSLNVGVAQVQGEERDIDRVKAVAQLETDYKDVARIKVLVPVQSENVIKNIDRVPGVAVSAVADYAIKR